MDLKFYAIYYIIARQILWKYWWLIEFINSPLL